MFTLQSITSGPHKCRRCSFPSQPPPAFCSTVTSSVAFPGFVGDTHKDGCIYDSQLYDSQPYCWHEHGFIVLASGKCICCSKREISIGSISLDVVGFRILLHSPLQQTNLQARSDAVALRQRELGSRCAALVQLQRDMEKP